MEEIKSKIEAILYCIPEGINILKLSSILGIGSKGYVKQQLIELQEEYKKRNSGLKIIEENGNWRFEIKPEYTELVKDIAKPELSNAVLETLAFIAQKGKAKQIDIIKTRTNKAYDHIKELEKIGFVESEKKGRTKIIKLTKKFYEYFNLKEGETLSFE